MASDDQQDKLQPMQDYRARYAFRQNYADVEHDAHRAIKFIWAELNNQKLSVKDVARIAGISPELIIKWREGKRQPKLDTVEKVVNALGYVLYPIKDSEKPRIKRYHKKGITSGAQAHIKYKQMVLDIVSKHKYISTIEIIKIIYGTGKAKPYYEGKYPSVNKSLYELRDDGKISGPFKESRTKYWKRLKAHR